MPNIREALKDLTDDEVRYIASRLQAISNRAPRPRPTLTGMLARTAHASPCFVEAPDGLPPVGASNA